MFSERETFIAIIATSGHRTERLFAVALPSVLQQTRPPDLLLIVDDNDDPTEFYKIAERLSELTSPLDIRLLHNTRTHGFSGTGAWNTALYYAAAWGEARPSTVWIAILDDDDAWLPHHLECCSKAIKPDSLAIFGGLGRLHERYSENSRLRDRSLLTVDNFLYGDPGVQGSNMFFRLPELLAIGGFDEELRSSTDRDLMVRFLAAYGAERCEVLPYHTALHYVGRDRTVSTHPIAKLEGLDVFYKKHLWRFTDYTVLLRSLERAVRLFHYPHSREVLAAYCKTQEIIAVAMPLHNEEKALERAINSFLEQSGTTYLPVLFIGDNGASRLQKEAMRGLLEQHPNIVWLEIEGGTAARARNALQRAILEYAPNLYGIARLDADDAFASPTVLASIEAHLERTGAGALLASNLQVRGNEVVAENRATPQLGEPAYLLERLRRMTLGELSAELPSCNLFVRRAYLRPYPDVPSAEDHWLLVEYLLDQTPNTLCFVPELLHSVYSLEGSVTSHNRSSQAFIETRQQLYRYAQQRLQH